MIERTPQRAYLDLQKLARDQGRNTQQLFELYIHERNLRAVIAEIAEVDMADGVGFDTTTISVTPIREGAEYEGVHAPDAALWNPTSRQWE